MTLYELLKLTENGSTVSVYDSKTNDELIFGTVNSDFIDRLAPFGDCEVLSINTSSDDCDIEYVIGSNIEHDVPPYEYDDDYSESYEWDDGSTTGCSDCPDDECTGHCFSCAYRNF